MALGRHPKNSGVLQGRHPKNSDRYPEINGGSRDIINKITLYNQENEAIGKIYPRRAKQLVINGRAVWLDKGRIMDTSSAIKKEESAMIDENTCPPNGKREETPRPLEEADALLMYQAKQNVKDRKNLYKHMAAYIIAWPILGVLYNYAFRRMENPRWSHFNNVLSYLWDLAPHIPEEERWVFIDVAEYAEVYFRREIPDIWYVFVGMMLAWGFWIAARMAKPMKEIITTKLLAKSAKKAKPDPVIQEYNRLKNMTTEETM